MPDTEANFPLTHKSLVFRAAANPAGPAMDELCELYWEPLYAFYRSCRFDSHESQDLTQLAVMDLTQGQWLQKYCDSPDESFTGWLKTRARHWLTDEWRKKQTQKRGGGVEFVDMDFPGAEERYSFGGTEAVTPEQAFDRSLARSLLARSHKRIAAEMEAKDLGDLIAHLDTEDTERGEISQIAEQTGRTREAVSSALYRWRLRYREILREEVRRILMANRGEEVTEDEVDEEIQRLSGLLT